MKDNTCIISANDEIARDTYRMILQGDTSDITAPGQFVNLRLHGFFLRRPISLCDWQEDQFTLIYKKVGAGTGAMAQYSAGTAVEVLLPLGNGYDLEQIPAHPLLVGGGAGVPPMYGLARRLIQIGKTPEVLLGFKADDEVFYINEFQNLGLSPQVNIGGYITEQMPEDRYVCCCGPEPMLHAVYDRCAGGQFSFEARMGCGFGACMGCSCQTITGAKRICTEGPVLRKEEILWQTQA